ncbi:MAG: hypothetical protein ABR572_13130 [Cryomorphaceae bacterium]|nr:hypothetical protein [Flavobacteriales bacterium]
MIRKFLFSLAAIGVASASLQAQVYNWADGEEPDEPVKLEDLTGFVVGLNIGFYQANSNTASIYNGYGFDRAGARNNFANAWLNQALQGNDINRRNTRNAMGFSDDNWSFGEDDMPNEMRYTPSFMWGAHFRYHLNPDFAFFAEVGGTSPTTTGEFTIVNQSAQPGQLESQRINRVEIRGEEQRLLLTLGVRRALGREKKERENRSTAILPFFEFGVNSTFVSFEENFINLDLPTRDLTRFFQQQGFQVDEARQLTGVGFGAFGTLGIQIHLGSDIMIDLGYRPSFEHVKLGEWDQRGFQHIAVVRGVWTRF